MCCHECIRCALCVRWVALDLRAVRSDLFELYGTRLDSVCNNLGHSSGLNSETSSGELTSADPGAILGVMHRVGRSSQERGWHTYTVAGRQHRRLP